MQNIPYTTGFAPDLWKNITKANLDDISDANSAANDIRTQSEQQKGE
jgi:hypothetical protein